MAAPRIEQGGTVTVNGAAAYVAAEAVDLSINQGLFDIFISAGTTDANGVVHTGSTGGPASTGVGDRSEEHTSELQSLMRISYAVFCLKKKKQNNEKHTTTTKQTRRTKHITIR